MRLPHLVLRLWLLLALPITASAQTAATATVSGTVTDAQGAVIVGAPVKLTDVATHNERTVPTDAQGRYQFYAVSPGPFTVTVTAPGFKTRVVTDVPVEVSKAANVNVSMEVGDIAVTAQVVASVEAQLQTVDASVGGVLGRGRMERLPNGTRQVNPLFYLQPATTPSGEFAGARRDQSTFMLDGMDVSDNVIGEAARTVIPVPVESVAELRGVVANANATFGRSAGGQIALITKSGTNTFHGSAYLYHQDNALSANSWTNNRVGIARPFSLDNRFGGRFGGPLVTNRTFFFALYEGRRNPRAATATRLVPTDSYRAGMLRFRDAGGVVQTLDADAIRRLDPRGIGPNPKVLEYVSLYPAANDFTAGDGLNTAGFTFAAPVITSDNFGLIKLDHQFSDRWNAGVKFSANREINTNTNQVDLQRKAGTGSSPERPRNAAGTLIGVLSPALTNEARFSWLHDRRGFFALFPRTFVGLNVPINLGSAFLDDLMDVDTGRARQNYRTINVYQWSDTVTGIKRAHTIQAGGNVRRIRAINYRDDKVFGSITTPVADVSAGAYISIPTLQRPGFIQSADVGRYNNLYAALLGMVSEVPMLITRDAQFNLQPFGTGLLTRSTLTAWEFYASDTWRWKPSLTVTYGLTYNWQEPPVEESGKQLVLTFKDTGQLVDYRQYMRDKLAAAEAGRIYNPDLAYTPLKQTGRRAIFNTDFTNFSPRLAVAWNPSLKDGWLGRLFGDRKTVLRGGYSLIFDRTNTVQTITIPTLGVGFAQTVGPRGPEGAPGQPFRIGIDGPIPLPTAPATVPSPIVPSKPYGDSLASSVDPFIKVPRNHVVDVTVQCELPGSLLLEVGYIGRFARNLYVNGNLNSVPFTQKDPTSGQTFAQAFDAIAAQVRSNTPVTAQPYFENLYGPGTTAAMVSTRLAAIRNGDISILQQIYLDALAFGRGVEPITNLQAQNLLVRISGARSNYHGMVLSLRKRFAQGLAFDVNYTLSKSLDQSSALHQNDTTQFQSSFYPDIDYAPSLFDIRHLFNANGTYELPFGLGHRLSTRRPAVDKFFGGWFVAGIFTAHSGLPLTVKQTDQAFGGDSLFGLPAAIGTGAIPLQNSHYDPGVHSGYTIGPSGVGATGDPARLGAGLNLFADPEQVYNNFRPVLLSLDRRHGRGALRGLNRWNADLSVGKETRLRETVKLRLAFDFINAFNHVILADPALDLRNKATFGVLGSQFNTPRRIQVGVRIDF